MTYGGWSLLKQMMWKDVCAHHRILSANANAVDGLHNDKHQEEAVDVGAVRDCEQHSTCTAIDSRSAITGSDEGLSKNTQSCRFKHALQQSSQASGCVLAVYTYKSSVKWKAIPPSPGETWVMLLWDQCCSGSKDGRSPTNMKLAVMMLPPFRPNLSAMNPMLHRL